MLSKQDIIKIFLEKDLQLDNESLNFFLTNQEKINPFLQKIEQKKEKPLIITKKLIDETFPQTREIKILKEFHQLSGSFSTEDILKFFNERYDFVRKILMKRLDLINIISINRISRKLRKFSIIAIVSERNEGENSVEAEDLTGRVTIYLDKKNFDLLPLDTIAGFICEWKDDKLVAEQVIFPDIPLKKEVSKTINDNYCFFVSDFHLEVAQNQKIFENFLSMLHNLDYPNLSIFFLGDISPNKEDYEKIIENIPKNCSYFFLKGEDEKNIDIKDFFEVPIILQIEDVKIFLAHGEFFSQYLRYFKTPENAVLQLLKQRNFNPTFSSENFSNAYLIDIVPDIIAVGHFHNPIYQNYKGTTIILNGSFNTQPIYWLLNLRTREINKISLI
jgi:DNA polymerase II small subunit/DNA polymerase delta subunit B